MDKLKNVVKCLIIVVLVLASCAYCTVKPYSEGYDEGYDKGYEEGYDEGRGEGYDEGYKKGYDEGYATCQEDFNGVSSPTVYVTRNGTKYHRKNCTYLSGNAVIAAYLEVAKEYGYAPCSKCKPGY